MKTRRGKRSDGEWVGALPRGERRCNGVPLFHHFRNRCHAGQPQEGSYAPPPGLSRNRGANQPELYQVDEWERLSASATISLNTSNASSNASRVMQRGGFSLIVPPPGPTGAKVNTPRSYIA